MAYFERGDERDMLIVCNICNAKCAERSLTNHRAKCSERHSSKFAKGQLLKCSYDSGHIVEAGQMNWHLEFCTKYQNKLVEEFQEEDFKVKNPLVLTGINNPASSGFANPPGDSLNDEDWNRDADERFVEDLSKLKLNDQY